MQFTAKFASSITIAAAFASAIVVPRQAAPEDYTLTYTNQTGAVQGTDFLTFALVETTDGGHFSRSSSANSLTWALVDCLAFCDSVPTCGFANSALRPSLIKYI